jgi:hypothetical protein
LNTPNDKKPFWDFNPKRGALYSLAAFVFTPVSLGIDYLFRLNFDWQSILFASLVMAVVIGILGTFTEHIDF